MTTFFLLLFLSVWFPIHSSASVVLNEVAIQPTQSVELYNSASTSADISSWYIDDAGGTTYFTIPANTMMPPFSCLVFNSDFNFNKSSTDTIRLFDNTYPPTSSSAKLIEQYSYAKAPDTNYSFSKKMDGGGEWQTTNSTLGQFNESLLSCVPTPTPTPTSLPTPTSEPTVAPPPVNFPEPTQTPLPSATDYNTIFLSEIFPYPETGNNEWVELYNGNDTSVNLVNWYIDDGENTGGTPKRFSLSLESHEYKSIDLSTSLFNNTGDTVRLLNTDKQEKESMEYGKITEGKSIGRVSFTEDSYCEQEQSKNTTNFSCIQEPTDVPALDPTQKPAMVIITKKIIPTTKLQMNQTVRQINTPINPTYITTPQKQGEVLGEQTSGNHVSPIPYLSGTSFSYSLLTIISVFIKMKNA